MFNIKLNYLECAEESLVNVLQMDHFVANWSKLSHCDSNAENLYQKAQVNVWLHNA